MLKPPPRRLLFLLALTGAVCAAYANTFAVPFLFDDEVGILENLRLRRLWPLLPLLTGTMRPLTELTFALNYAVGGYRVAGYHLVNLGLHWLAALTLYGVLRRTFQTAPLRPTWGGIAQTLGFTVALLWSVHPLHTNAVTYLSQRAEVLMSLCYLLALYGLIRSTQAPQPRRWEWLAVLSCAAGMASKPIMVTAPLILLAYDRLFLASSWQGVARRWRLHAALASTWGLLGLLLTGMIEVGETNVGFHQAAVSPGAYAWTQAGVFWHYLRLAVWPDPLVFDYGWPLAQPFQEQGLAVLAFLGLLGMAAWAWVRRRPESFIAVWVLGILLPSSSFIPVADAAFEYRMYLPLAGVITLLVAAASAIGRRWVPPAGRRLLAVSLTASAAAVLAAMTWGRNQTYRSAEALWQDVVAKRPHHARAYANLGVAFLRQGDVARAAPALEEALRRDPLDVAAHNARANLLAAQGRLPEALEAYRITLQLAPALAPRILYNMANALARQARYQEAVRCYAAALRLQPAFVDAHNNWGNVLLLQGRREEAARHYQAALALAPHDPGVAGNLALARTPADAELPLPPR